MHLAEVLKGMGYQDESETRSFIYKLPKADFGLLLTKTKIYDIWGRGSLQRLAEKKMHWDPESTCSPKPTSSVVSAKRFWSTPTSVAAKTVRFW